MLTADLVRTRRRDGKLDVVPLSGALRARARAVAAAYVEAAAESVGRTRADLDRALAAVAIEARERRVADGLRKLVLDRCTFEADPEIDPVELRRDLFVRAAAARAALEGDDARFDRDAIVAEVARERAISTAGVERILYADLRDAHRVLAFDAIGPDALLARYDASQVQAVLLRAVRVEARVRCAAPSAYRALFRRLKFLRLLHRIEPEDGGYRIEIDGPYSLFQSVTKYGLALALALPAIEECDAWSLRADVLWGKDRSPLVFAAEGGARREAPSGDGADDAALPDEVAALVERFRARSSRWAVAHSTAILSLPGVGVCVPDLVFTDRDRGARVYLEVLGHWSRDAVWKRVELARAGLGEKIVFAVPSRLRVSEEVLDGDLPAALYVFKGSLAVRAIEERLDALVT